MPFPFSDYDRKSAIESEMRLIADAEERRQRLLPPPVADILKTIGLLRRIKPLHGSGLELGVAGFVPEKPFNPFDVISQLEKDRRSLHKRAVKKLYDDEVARTTMGMDKTNMDGTPNYSYILAKHHAGKKYQG